MYNGIIIHYNEIAIKGKNRVSFEHRLISNIDFALDKKYDVKRFYGVIYVSLKDPISQEVLFLKEKLSLIPGISNFSFVVTSSLDIEDVKEKTLNFLKHIDFSDFKVDSKRSNKSYKYKSPEINVIVGEAIINGLNKKVNILNPEKTVFIEVIENQIHIFIEKFKGVGGLPVGVGAKVICSLSGGIDSPVAAYLFMKRGSPVTFVHIYNNTLVKSQILDKIKSLVKILSKFQQKSKLYIVPFSDIQKNIVANVHSDYRMIVYRRYMLKIISDIALKENGKAIITGDNIGQVASQTLENMTSIYSATTYPIFSPVITFDKNEIISLAKKIDTYKTSIIPYPDCCSFMLSKHPKTKTTIQEILDIEKNISNEKKLISSAIGKAEVFLF